MTRLREGCRLWLLGLLLGLGNAALAASYTLPATTFSPCQGTWTSATNTCSSSGGSNNGQISFANGDTLTSTSAQVLTADGGFVLRGNVIGSASNSITLQAAYNPISTGNTSASTIYGAVINASGTITLSNVTINGSIQTSSGAVTLTSSSVSGSVTGTGSGNLTSTNVGGNVRFDNGLTVNGGTLSGTASTNGNASFTNATVVGAVTATNGLSASNTNFSGTITATNGASSITGGTINADINGNCCKITISGAYVTGNLSSTNEFEITNSSITGNISNNNKVTFNNSTVYGNVTAATWTTITGTGASKVYGNCTPTVTSPTTLCDSVPITTCFSDNFNRASLGTSNWAVTSRNGSFGVPVTNAGRLRLTDNTGNVATAATLQRFLPATGNFVQVQFKYYAYNGNGADGVAVIFSNASITPQPGGYGGSLGYAQLNGTSGFAGGWLGIALDEYGNFSNPTETRNGGPGLRQDSVSIRGSGSNTTGYRYLAGTAAGLNPGIDISGSTPGPGHTYRITLDSTVAGKTMVTVERNSGSGFVTLVSAFNAQVADQTALPSDFFVSLTGSTGGSNNVHELDDFQVCATRISPVGQQIDHFELEHQGNALTCSPLPVTVKACVDSAVPCTTPYTGTSPPLTATLSPAGWSGLSFSNGSANAQLAIRSPGTVRMNVDSSTPPLTALARTWCKTGTSAWGTGTACDVAFADSGFNFIFGSASSAANPPISMIAAAPKLDGKIQAVKKDATSPACVPAFAGVTRTLGFRAAYIDPTVGQTVPLGIADRPLEVNGTNVTHTATTSLNLAFDATGAAPLTLRYSDAGKVSLTASYTGSAANGDAGLSMSSATEIRSRPYGLCVQTDSICTDAGVNDNCKPFPGGIRAGDSFPVRIKAVAWQAKSDGSGEDLTATALCFGNLVTPKFTQDKIALSSTVVAPVGGGDGSTSPATYNHSLGNQTNATTSISEVGVFRLVATPPAEYLSTEQVSITTSDLVGRFIPAYLSAVGDASLTPSCVNSDPLKSYSYQGQPIAFANDQEPKLTITGYNRQGVGTSNYDRGDFWQLRNPPKRTRYTSVTGVAGLDALTGTPPVPVRLQESGLLESVYLADSGGDGMRTARWNDQSLWYIPPSMPTSDDLPFSALISLNVTGAELKDADGACHTNGNKSVGAACQDYFSDADPSADRGPGFGGSKVRLGRLQVGNAHGSEFQNLTLPLRVESWQKQTDGSGSFKLEAQDGCTTSGVLGTAVLSDFTGQLSLATWDTPLSPLMISGQGGLTLPHPDVDGSVRVNFATPTWLFYPWDGVTRQPAKGLASFGIYKGAAPLIFRRELYRSP